MLNRKSIFICVKFIFKIVYIIIILFLISFSFILMNNLSKNKITSLFGKYYLRIESASMTSPVYNSDNQKLYDGFKIGDIVTIKKCKISKIQMYDIIAFYKCNIDDNIPFYDFDKDVQKDFNNFNTSGSRYSGQRIFHQIINIEIDDDGYVWYTTKGSSNGDVSSIEKDAIGIDSQKVRSDFVIGVYEKNLFSNILKFITSTTGIIILIITPSFLILIFLFIKIFKSYNQIKNNKKIK